MTPESKPETIDIFTSVNLAYLPKARVLAESVKRYAPNCRFHLMLSDKLPSWLDLTREYFDSIIRLEDLDIEPLWPWVFQHRVVELCTAVKPFAVRYLFKQPGVSHVIYFDPDIVLFSGLERLLEHFEEASVLLTPHICTPETDRDGIVLTEISCLKHGIFNLGFIGLKNDPQGNEFLGFWAERCRDFCYDNIPGGIFTDQRWIDFAPALFPFVKILRQPYFNIASWNFSSRQLEGSPQRGLFAAGEAVCFYHFSGIDAGAHQMIREKFCPTNRTLLDLEEWYNQRCREIGERPGESYAWAYGTYDNGESIQNDHRLLYRKHPDLREAFPNPYAAGPDSFLSWVRQHPESSSGVRAGRFNAFPPEFEDIFWEQWYVSFYSDVGTAIARGLFRAGREHYQTFGRREGRWPNPFFDPLWYIAVNRPVLEYLRANGDASVVDHYCRSGALQGMSTNPVLNEDWYIAHNPDVATAVEQGAFPCAFLHYLKHGWKEGRSLGPGFDEQNYRFDETERSPYGGRYVNGLHHFLWSGRFMLQAARPIWL